MEIQHTYNYNDPLELREVFKVTLPGQPTQEVSGMVCVCWEDIRGVEQFAINPDSWTQFPGEKFFLILSGRSEPKLILGSYENIVEYWKQMRNLYPSFVDNYKEEDEEEEEN